MEKDNSGDNAEIAQMLKLANEGLKTVITRAYQEVKEKLDDLIRDFLDEVEKKYFN